MSFEELTTEDKRTIRKVYLTADSRKIAQEELAKVFSVTERTIRNWAKEMEVGVLEKNKTNPRSILIYDIETPRLAAELWWSGKQFVNGLDITDEPRIISIAWKWVGEDKVYSSHWDLETQDDSEMVKGFLEEYNKADLVVGINNNRFDNRWINARAIKHGFTVNNFVKSLDVQKEAKRLLRLPSYSLKYLAQYLDVPVKKQEHEGIIMWKKIQYGTMPERIEYMRKMLDYNTHDILATEGVYLRLLPIIDNVAHLGINYGNGKYSCPHCGEVHGIELFKTTVTKAGTVQHIMQCLNDGTKYKVSNREYLNWLKL